VAPIDPRKLTRWYDFQAPCYALWRNRYDSPLVALVTAQAARRAPAAARLLDLGCGTGLFSVALAERLPAARVAGVDLSSGMLAVARAQAERRGALHAAFCRADAATLPFAEDSFDAAVAAGLLPNVNDRVAILAELRRVLCPGGHLLVVEFDRGAMGPALRLFFFAMILGYRAVSFVFRRFRFAEGWNTRTSTVEPQEVLEWAARAGLEPAQSTAGAGHRIFDLVKPGLSRGSAP
jgi:ubiquinone/menaquinone biosynthesis C-methylase UbiE